MKIIAQVERWCARPGNSKAKLAALLGYESSSTVSNWISRGSIPKHQIERIKVLIGGKV